MQRRFLAGLACLTVAAIVGVVALSAGASKAAAAPSSGCVQYEFIGARGSGQSFQPGKSGDEGVGPEIDAVWQALQSDLQNSGVTISLVPVPDPPYQAVGVYNGFSSQTGTGVGAYFHLPAGYHNSVDKIEPWVTQEVAAESAACPNTKFILAGYSQGAQGLADALQRDLDPSQVLGAAFFGDPYFNPTSAGDWGSYDTKRSGLLGTRPDYSDAISGQVFS